MRELLTNAPRNELVEDMPFDEYREASGLQTGTLTDGMLWEKIGRRYVFSPKHCRASYRQQKTASNAMRLGDAGDVFLFDCMVPAVRSEPTWERAVEHAEATFATMFGVWNGKSRSGKAWEEFHEEWGSRHVVVNETKDELSKTRGMVFALLMDPVAREVYESPGLAQASLFVGEGGLQHKTRLDWTATELRMHTDLKTTAANGRIVNFGDTAFDLKYDVKMALQQRRFDAVTGLGRWPVSLVVVEQDEPFDVTVVDVPQGELDGALEVADAAIEHLATAIRRDHYPGVAEGKRQVLARPTYRVPYEEDVIYDGT